MLNKNWDEWATAPIFAGGKVRVDYDEARLPTCRAYHNGNPGWQITAYLYFLPGKTLGTAELFQHATTASGTDYYSWVKQIPELEVPAGTTEIQAWFKNESGFDSPCTAWDSNFGQNYRLEVDPAPNTTTVTFRDDWNVEQSAEIAAGETLAVSYDTDRMVKIANGNQSYSYFAAKYHCYGYGCCSHDYDNRLNVRYHASGAFTAHTIQPGQPVLLTVPADASRVELYFDAEVTTTTWYCGGAEGPKYVQTPADHFYDSHFAKNFVFPVK